MNFCHFSVFLLVLGIILAPGVAHGQESSATVIIKNPDSTVYVRDNADQILFSVEFVNFPRDNKISARLVQVSTGEAVHEQLLNTNSIPTGTNERLDNLAVPTYKYDRFGLASSWGKHSLQIVSEHGRIMGEADVFVSGGQPPVSEQKVLSEPPMDPSAEIIHAPPTPIAPTQEVPLFFITVFGEMANNIHWVIMGMVGMAASIAVMRVKKNKFKNLMTMKIPKTEDIMNEFKAYYLFDYNLEDPDKDEDFKRRKKQERKWFYVKAVCAFGNSYDGGFIYLGIEKYGKIVGLEKDRRFGGFYDYGDIFANDIRGTLGVMIKDNAFLADRIKIQFRKIRDKTICITQVLPATQPLFLYFKNEKKFYVRGATPRVDELKDEYMYRYIKKRFPDYE